MNVLKRLWKEEDAATATEYAIIAAILGSHWWGFLSHFASKSRDSSVSVRRCRAIRISLSVSAWEELVA